MDVAASDSHLFEILIEFLCHTFGQCGYKNSFVKLRSFSDLLEQVIHLILGRTDFNRRIQKTGRSNDLFHHKTF